MQNLKNKLTSRKLWVAIVGIVVGIAAAFGIEGNDYANIAGIVTAAASVVSYVFGEAKIDANNKETVFVPIEEYEEIEF